MKTFRVCVVETREYIHEIEARSPAEAEELAKDVDAADGAVSDQFREQVVDWVVEL